MFLEHSIFPWIGITAKMHASYINKIFKEHTIDLTKEQFVVLKVLTENNCKPQHDIALITESDKTSFSRLISTMEKKGLISRKSVKKDKRLKHICLTNLGKELYSITLPIIKKSFEKLQEGITNSEISQAIETIKKIQLNITQEHSLKL